VTAERPVPAPVAPVLRRGGWALPAEPPETWVGARWAVGLLVALAVAVGLPVLRALELDGPGAGLAVTHAVAGTAAAVTGYLLLVQASLTGDPRLRWVAAGYAAVLAVVVGRSFGLHGPEADAVETAEGLSRAGAALLLTQLVLPVFVLTSGAVSRSLRWLALPVLLLAVPAALAIGWQEPLPDLLVPPGDRTALLQGLDAGAAGLCLVAALVWWRSSRRTGRGARGPWGVVLAGLAVAPLVGGVRALSSARYDDLWWASAVVEDAALCLPAVGLLVQGTHGYFRQARRWHQLEQEVRRLRTATALLPGRSITPEDEAGLPEEPEVRALVEQRRVRIALQPVVELATGDVVGHEALSRFGGRTPTDRWFRAASRHGLGGALEQVTLGAALQLLPRLPAGTFLAVNVSPAALADPVVVQMLHDSDLARVVVEITEHEAVADYPQARAVLDRLRARGARIAVDDTGAGFASLRHVLLLQPEVIKLDTSITRDVETDERQQALVRALLSFAAEVGSEVLAEGIETEEQLRALIDIGVPTGQGWHLGLPAVPED
jgi:EAL domain-containing protein (putative c-di-GMP-specific phosphodiesterase class I)